MSARVLGSTDVVAQPMRRRWRKGKGWSTVRSWRGPLAAIEALARDPLVDDAEEMEIKEQGGGHAELEAVYAYDLRNGSAGRDELNEIWETFPQEIQKPIAQAAAIRAVTSSASWLEQADKHIREGDAVAWKDASGNAVPAAIKSYVELKLAGVEAFTIWVDVIQKTTRCGSASALKASYSGAGAVTATIAGFNPTLARFALPSGVEFLKERPAVQEVVGGYHIVERWRTAEKWSATLYSGGTGTP